MFLSLVRPDRISSPMTSKAAVTESATMVSPFRRFNADLGPAQAVALERSPPPLLGAQLAGYLPPAMRFTAPLLEGRLVQRYKRFLADIDLASGERVTAHCANPGAMLGLTAAGNRVLVSRSTNP